MEIPQESQQYIDRMPHQFTDSLASRMDFALLALAPDGARSRPYMTIASVVEAKPCLVLNQKSEDDHRYGTLISA